MLYIYYYYLVFPFQFSYLGAGDLLVDFTTRNGNWFLEELCSMINNLDNFFKFIYFCSFVSMK